MGVLDKLFKKKEKIRMITHKPSKLDLDSIEGILSISVPRQKSTRSTANIDITSQVEYVLQRKATEHKRNGKMDLAIACLRKSNEIMPFSSFGYTEKDYLRLVEYLKQNGQFEEAKAEEIKIKERFSTAKKEKLSVLSGYYDKKSPYYKSDLIESTDSPFVCEECAKYNKRIFSEFGFNPKYPKLPDYLKNNKHEYCCINFFPVLDGISVPSWDYEGDLIKYCNRPFVDERTSEEKEVFDKEVARREREKRDRIDYDFVREQLPDIAPKSFGGYRKMKNNKSDNYKKIVRAAKEKGYLIE